MVRTYLLVITVAATTVGCEPERDALPTPAEPTLAPEAVLDTQRAAPTLGTPIEALEFYIESLRRGDVEGVLQVSTTETFQLPGPIEIDSFKVLRHDTLTAAAAEERRFIPQPQAGDVELDVLQYEYGQEQMYSYNLRRIENNWRIYAHSAWGVGYYEDEP